MVTVWKSRLAVVQMNENGSGFWERKRRRGWGMEIKGVGRYLENYIGMVRGEHDHLVGVMTT